MTINRAWRALCGVQPAVPTVLGISGPAQALEQTLSEKGKKKEGGVEEEGREGKGRGGIAKEELRSEAMRRRK